ncbi:MAG: tetratricopeptide repeat protein [Magnetococcales bacterium]|nr:tetratricopeptide repeat protein [Magnetococcales bacterium]
MNTEALFVEGQRQMLAGHFQEGVVAFSEVLRKDPHLHDAYQARGAVRIMLMEYPAAISDLTAAIAMDDTQALSYFERGCVFRLMGCFEEAVRDFTKALVLKPDHGPAYLARGLCFVKLGRDQMAEVDLGCAVKLGEKGLQGFADEMGMIRTRRDEVEALLTGERGIPVIHLPDEEMVQLKGLFH